MPHRRALNRISNLAALASAYDHMLAPLVPVPYLFTDESASALPCRSAVPERPQRPPARGGADHRGSAARPRRRGHGQDGVPHRTTRAPALRSEEHTSELQSLMRISYAVFCLQKTKN